MSPECRNDRKSLSLRHRERARFRADFAPHEIGPNMRLAGRWPAPKDGGRWCRQEWREALGGIWHGCRDGGALVAASGSRCGVAGPSRGRSCLRGLRRSSGATAEPFSFERLIVQAKEMAQRAYEPRPAAAQWLSDLSPEQYREIRYRPDQRAAAGRQPVLAPAVPSRLIPPLSGAGVRGRGGSGARGPLRPVVVRLRPGPGRRALGQGRRASPAFASTTCSRMAGSRRSC